MIHFSDIKKVSRAGLIAAAYVILTLLTSLFGFGNGPIQIRLSEALIILCCLYPEAIWGVTLGCFLANLLSGCIPIDLALGTAATFSGALSTLLIARLSTSLKHKKLMYAAPVPNVIINAAVVAWLFAYCYGYEGTYFYFFVTLLISEFLSSFVIGDILLAALEKRPQEKEINRRY